MNTKNTFITLGGLVLVGLVAFVFYPSSSKAGSGNYEIQRNLSVEPFKSDVIKLSESYERILDSYIVSVESRFGENEEGLKEVLTKLDTIENKIDILDRRLERIENALNTSKDIPNPKSPPPEEID